MAKIYIVTNFGGMENYTPSVFGSKEEALSWMDALALGNLDVLVDFPEVEKLSNNDFLEYAKEIGEYKVKVFNGKDSLKEARIIGDPDEYGNLLQLFEVDMPENIEDVIVQDRNFEDYQTQLIEEQDTCRSEVVAYINAFGDEFFSNLGVSKEEVIANEGLIEHLASEHFRNVYKYDCDVDWSLDEVMNNEPGLTDAIKYHLGQR